MATRKSEDVAKEKLIDSVKTSLNDAESLLREAASSTGDKATELRERAMTSVSYTHLHAVLIGEVRRLHAPDDHGGALVFHNGSFLSHLGDPVV